MAMEKKAGKGAKKILVIDDDLSDLRTIKMALEKEGYSVYAAGDGRQGMEIAAKEPFSLILLDIQMPDISGYEMLRLFRQRQNGGSKIIFVSIVQKKDVDLDGVDGFVQKPFSVASLVFEVKKAIG